MLVEYVHSRPDQLENAIGEFPLALIPHGALEWHGLHMPLGFDGLKAEALLRKAGEALGKGVIFPTRYWGSFDNMKFPYTFHFSKYSAKRVAKQLYKMGFRIIIMLTGHYPASQIKKMKGAAKCLMKKHDDAFALGIPEQFLLHDQGYVGDHAARDETSISMALFPEMTDVSKLPKGYSYFDRVQYLGIMGHDPVVHATKDRGQKLVDLFVERLVGLIEQAWEGKSQEPFLQVYRDAKKRFSGLKRVNNLDKTVDALGMDSKRDFLSHLKWMLFKGQKMQERE